VKLSLHKRCLIKLFTQVHWSHSQSHTNNGLFQACGTFATSLLTLLFTQYKTTLLSAISSHCLAALPAKMSAFNSHMRQNIYYPNLKQTFKNLLPCYCYAIKTNSRTHNSSPHASFATDFCRCQAKFLTSAKFLTYCLSVILLLKVKK